MSPPAWKKTKHILSVADADRDIDELLRMPISPQARRLAFEIYTLFRVL